MSRVSAHRWIVGNVCRYTGRLGHAVSQLFPKCARGLGLFDVVAGFADEGQGSACGVFFGVEEVCAAYCKTVPVNIDLLAYHSEQNLKLTSVLVTGPPSAVGVPALDILALFMMLRDDEV
jgi:hypothetical protein